MVASVTAPDREQAKRIIANAIASAAELANECGAMVLYSDLKQADDALVALAAQLAERERALREIGFRPCRVYPSYPETSCNDFDANPKCESCMARAALAATKESNGD